MAEVEGSAFCHGWWHIHAGAAPLHFILEGSGSQFALHHTMEYYAALRMSGLHLHNSMNESTTGSRAWKEDRGTSRVLAAQLYVHFIKSTVTV